MRTVRCGGAQWHQLRGVRQVEGTAGAAEPEPTPAPQPAPQPAPEPGPDLNPHMQHITTPPQEENDAAESSFKEMMAGDSPIIKPCPNCQVSGVAGWWGRARVIPVWTSIDKCARACAVRRRERALAVVRLRAPRELHVPPLTSCLHHTRKAPILKTAGCNFMSCSSCNSPDKMCWETGKRRYGEDNCGGGHSCH